MKASTLEKINTRIQRELGQAKRRARKAELALARDKDKFSELHALATKMADERDGWAKTAAEMRILVQEAEHQLSLERTVWRKFGKALHALLDHWAQRKKTRVWNWWLVKRLNKPRVEAVTEAGYIPAKLIKIAHQYWEHDQKRLQHDEQIVGGSDYTVYSRPPGFFRRLKIILGRA